MNNSDKLNKYIAVLKQRFPSFTYINTSTDESLESALSASACDYTIIVKNIPKSKFSEFRSYIDEHILYELIEKDEPLPCLIMLQREDLVPDIAFSLWNSIVKSHDQWLAVSHTPEFPSVSYSKKAWQRPLRKSNKTTNGKYLYSNIDRLAA